jgi:site-specific DNA-methyltransferase (adenine-specific)
VPSSVIPNGATNRAESDRLGINQIHYGDPRQLLNRIEPESIALSFWSPPYFVGKSYEKRVTYEEWQGLLAKVIRLHQPILKPGAFLVVNIADILCFVDPTLPRIQAESLGSQRG